MSVKEAKIKAVLAGFIGDSFSLGMHWNYDSAKLKDAFPDGIREFLPPGELSYKGAHAGKGAGAFTHYGGKKKIVVLHDNYYLFLFLP